MIVISFLFLYGYDERNLEIKFRRNRNNIIIYLKDSSKKNNKIKLFLDTGVLVYQKPDKI